MSREADEQISSILARFDIPMAGNVWRVQGTPVMYHKTLEVIAAQLEIVFQPPTILRAERDECVMVVHGSMRARGEDGKPTDKTLYAWSIGEALVNVNYRVSGKQAAYVYAMAEKRAKDRTILDLIGLSGVVYSEVEADEFKADPPRQGRPASNGDAPDTPAEVEADLRGRIENAPTWESVRDLMLDGKTQEALSYLAPGIRDDIRAFATTRLKALGWVPKTATPAGQGGARGGERARR